MTQVAALYAFARLADPAGLAARLRAAALSDGILGTLILAPEGVNGTVAGPADGIARLLDLLRGVPGLGSPDVKLGTAPRPPFARLKIRLRPEIVTMGVPGIDPLGAVGRHVAPRDWNALIAAPDVAVIDTRNAYEVAIGSFAGAIDPGTRSFAAFPGWWRANRDRFRGRKVAMFCTGGIRCEKSTSLLVSEGVEEVYHLRGGILNYLAEVPPQESLWRGECFVFDERVAVGHGLRPGQHRLCRACGGAVAIGADCAVCAGRTAA